MKRSHHYPARLRYVLIFLAAVAVVTIHHVEKSVFKPRLESVVYYEENMYAGVRDPSVTCDFPLIHPFHPSILKHISIAEPIRCFARSRALTYIATDGSLRFNESALREAGYGGRGEVNDDKSLRCHYQQIVRPSDDDFRVVYEPPRPMTGRDPLSTDFVYVECLNFAGVAIYKNFHAHVQRSPTVRRFKNDRELGAVVIGLDSMSRLNFMRQLPATYRFMVGLMDATVLMGFGKVGENTFPNVLPMLTGRPPVYDTPYNYFQSWPFVWHQFRARGAATLYAEDLPEFNMFDYLDTGVRHQPTTHYMRPFWLAAEDSILYKMSSPYCLGPTPKHVVYLDYIRSFLRMYQDSPQFVFSLLNEPSHDYINTVGAIDSDLVDFLNSSFTDNLFNRSVVFILGDHGNRMDPIRATEVGRIEDCMPMVSVVVPAWVDQIYPGWQQALQDNSRRLLSSYDIHATFLEILGTLEAGNADTDQWDEEPLSETLLRHFSGHDPGLSFFHAVPVNRSCDTAGIPDWLCVCQHGDMQSMSTTDPKALNAAAAAVEHINKVLLRGLSKCARQRLTHVESVRITQYKQAPRMQLVFRTEPGGGIFEANIDVHDLGSLGKETFDIVGELVRINRYGTQADCLPRTMLADTTILRGVCFCIT